MWDKSCGEDTARGDVLTPLKVYFIHHLATFWLWQETTLLFSLRFAMNKSTLLMGCSNGFVSLGREGKVLYLKVKIDGTNTKR